MYNKKDIEQLKQYYHERELFYQLAVLVSLVLGYLIGLIS